MQPLTESFIRSSFINASRKEVKDATLPDHLGALAEADWGGLDFLGWRDPKFARRAYVVLPRLEGDPVGIIEGVSTTYNAQQRTLGFQDAMGAAGAKVVSVQSGQWEIDKGNTVAAGMLRENPDLKAILAGNDSMALGVVAAVKASGRTGKVDVVGYDNIAAIKPMLKDGRVLATADQFAAKQAVFGIEIALKALAEKKKQNDMPAEVKTDVVLVTKDTK